MKTLGLFALAGLGAGLGYLLYTEKGRSMARQAGDYMKDGYQRASEALGGRNGVEHMVQEVLEEPRPDTAMAGAFEEALAS